MKVGLGSDIQAYIFFLYSARENIQSAYWFSDWDMSECFLSAPCHLLPERHQLPLIMAMVRGSPDRVCDWSNSPKSARSVEGLTGLGDLSGCEIKWTCCGEEASLLRTLFCLPLSTSTFLFPEEIFDAIPLGLQSSDSVHKKWDITKNH